MLCKCYVFTGEASGQRFVIAEYKTHVFTVSVKLLIVTAAGEFPYNNRSHGYEGSYPRERYIEETRKIVL